MVRLPRRTPQRSLVCVLFLIVVLSSAGAITPHTLAASHTPASRAAAPRATSGVPAAPFSSTSVYLPMITLAPPLTSIALIDQALTGGQIDAETALIYKVFVEFGDPRLPAQYHGDDTGLGEINYVNEAGSRFSTLSATAQTILQPFFVPPYYQSSWYAQRHAALKTAASSAPWPDRCGAPGTLTADTAIWATVDTSPHVRIWYTRAIAADRALAQTIATAIDTTIWPKLAGPSGVLKRGPLPDDRNNIRCNGGDGRLDIAILDMAGGRSQTVAYPDVGCQQTPAYMLFDYRAGLDILAHEFMHAIQWSYTLKAGCMYPGDYAWWAEASAEWAGNYVYPNAGEEDRISHWFMDTPQTSLETKNDRHEYGSFLWPLYLSDYAGKNGDTDVVRRVWEAAAGSDSLAAIDGAVAGGFDQRWPEFAAFNWNKQPVDKYRQWDGITVQATATPVTASPAGSALWKYQLDQPLPHLTARYYDVTFPPGAPRYVYFNNQQLGTAGYKLQALVKQQNQWQPLADWSSSDTKTFCRDRVAERIDELVLVLSNSTWGSSATDQPGAFGYIAASNIGCIGWHGSSTVTWTDSRDVGGIPSGFRDSTTTTGVTLKRPVTDPGGGAIGYEVTGGTTTESYGPFGACSADIGSGHLVSTAANGSVSIFLEPTVQYVAVSYIQPALQVNLTCGGGSPIPSSGSPFWLWSGEGQAGLQSINDPTHLQGQGTSPDGSLNATWDLTADPPE